MIPKYSSSNENYSYSEFDITNVPLIIFTPIQNIGNNRAFLANSGYSFSCILYNIGFFGFKLKFYAWYILNVSAIEPLSYNAFIYYLVSKYEYNKPFFVSSNHNFTVSHLNTYGNYLFTLNINSSIVEHLLNPSIYNNNKFNLSEKSLNESNWLQ